MSGTGRDRVGIGMGDSFDSRESEFDAVRCLGAPLAEKLETWNGLFTKRAPQLSQAYEDMVSRMRAAGAGRRATKAGSLLPPFLLPDLDGRLVDSRGLLVAGPLVVSFNRGHWCSFCRLELLELNANYEQVRELGGNIVSITPERAPSMAAFRRQWDIRFPILCDIDNSYALANGLMISVGEPLHRIFERIGVDLTAYQGNCGYFVPIPATYVVARDGRVLAAHVDPDFRHRMASEDILAALREAR